METFAMEKFIAIECISEALKSNTTVKAIFLKGSLARQDFDRYSDVDLYCLVDPQSVDTFLPQRISILETYKLLLYVSEVNFVCPQILAVFDNGLHFDLYTVTIDNLPQTDAIKVLYDPHHFLSGYTPHPLQYEHDEVLNLIHEFACTLLEFETAFLREDLFWAWRLTSHCVGYLSGILRYVHDPAYSRFGAKKSTQGIPVSMYSRMVNALEHCCPSQLPQGVSQLITILDELIPQLPIDIQTKINYDFLNFFKKRVNKLLADDIEK